MSGDLRALVRLLRREGLGDAKAEAAGYASDIAAIRLPPQQLFRLKELSERIRGLGFRYVALDWDESED